MSEDYGLEDNSSQWRRPGFLAAAAVVAVIVVLGLVLAGSALFGSEESDEPATGAPTPGASSTSPLADPGASICGLPGHETSGTVTEAPSAVTWTLVRKTAVPKSETAGPAKIEQTGLRYCYSHTPAGALLAAANLLGWAAAAKTDPVSVADRNVAAGPGQVAFRAAAEEGFQDDGEPTDAPQIRGFNVVSYSESSAFVDVAYGVGGGYSHVRLELAWEDGDWKVRLMPDGTIPPFQALPDLTGFVAWSGA